MSSLFFLGEVPIPKSSNKTKVNKGNVANVSTGAFSRVFGQQKPKVKSPEEVSNLLTHFAEDDLKRIAVTIQSWMDKDTKEKNKNRAK